MPALTRPSPASHSEERTATPPDAALTRTERVRPVTAGTSGPTVALGEPDGQAGWYRGSTVDLSTAGSSLQVGRLHRHGQEHRGHDHHRRAHGTGDTSAPEPASRPAIRWPARRGRRPPGLSRAGDAPCWPTGRRTAPSRPASTRATGRRATAPTSSSSTTARRSPTACRTTATCSPATSRTSCRATRPCAATASSAGSAGTATACPPRSRPSVSSASSTSPRSRRWASRSSTRPAAPRCCATPTTGRSTSPGRPAGSTSTTTTRPSTWTTWSPSCGRSRPCGTRVWSTRATGCSGTARAARPRCPPPRPRWTTPTGTRQDPAITVAFRLGTDPVAGARAGLDHHAVDAAVQPGARGRTRTSTTSVVESAPDRSGRRALPAGRGPAGRLRPGTGWDAAEVTEHVLRRSARRPARPPVPSAVRLLRRRRGHRTPERVPDPGRRLRHGRGRHRPGAHRAGVR